MPRSCRRFAPYGDSAVPQTPGTHIPIIKDKWYLIKLLALLQEISSLYCVDCVIRINVVVVAFVFIG